ncbi:MAG: ArsR family transcriptional regulator [Fulvivirga sp.]
MEYIQAKEEFIQAWGALGSSWGINKTMAQIFALLIVTPRSMTVEEIMEELSISRGNVSMNLRLLIDWEIVERTTKKGERKDYYYCERDVWALCRKVAEQRKDREIKPVLKVLEQVNNIDTTEGEDAVELKRVTSELIDVVHLTDQALTTFTNSDRSWVSKTILSMMKKKK